MVRKKAKTGASGSEAHDRSRFCDSPRKKGRPNCERPAGWGTKHPGYGRCKLHGGNNAIKHGLYSDAWQKLLKDQKGEWDAGAAKIGDLGEEISILRKMAEHVAAKGEELDHEAFLKVIDRVIKAVSSQQQIQREGMITNEQFHRYMQAVGLVLLKHVKDQGALRRIESDVQAIPVLAG